MIISYIKEEFIKSLNAQTNISFDELRNLIEIPPDSKMWDLAFPCFVLSKIYKKNPAQIAEELSKKISSPYFKVKNISHYLNIFFDKKFYNQKVLQNNYTHWKKDERILLEFLSANPNKPLHIGQARNVCIGDTMSRVFKHLEYDTDIISYGDDSGVNVWYNIVGHLYYNIPTETDKKFDHYCGEVYTKMKKYEDEEFKKILSETLLKIEKWWDKSIQDIHEDYVTKCTVAQFKSCWDINSYFDLVNWETDILHLDFFHEAVEKLKNEWVLKFAEEWDAKWCWIIDLSSLEEFEKEDKQYQIIIKSDGVATYTGKDIAFAMWKLWLIGRDFYYKRLIEQPNWKIIYTTTHDSKYEKKYWFKNYDHTITVIDNRQSLPQKVVKWAIKLCNKWKELNKTYKHLGYGVVYLTPNTLEKYWFELTDEEKNQKKLPFSSRKWWVVTIDDTLRLMKEKAYQETKKRNPDKDELWIKDISNKIAISAFRFWLIRTDLNKDIIFDIDEITDMEWETGTYILYTFARISSILRQWNYNLESDDNIDFDLLTDETEFQLIKKLDESNTVLLSAKNELKPHLISRYLLDTCKLFNLYYNKINILKNEENLKNARLFMLIKIKEKLKLYMNIVWMLEVEKM